MYMYIHIIFVTCMHTRFSSVQTSRFCVCCIYLKNCQKFWCVLQCRKSGIVFYLSRVYLLQATMTRIVYCELYSLSFSLPRTCHIYSENSSHVILFSVGFQIKMYVHTASWAIQISFLSVCSICFCCYCVVCCCLGLMQTV